jgi:hypothetical protein
MTVASMNNSAKHLLLFDFNGRVLEVNEININALREIYQRILSAQEDVSTE